MPNLRAAGLDLATPFAARRGYRVTAAHAERGKPGRNLTHLGGVFAPGHRLGVFRCSKRHRTRVDRRGVLERLTQSYGPP